MGAKGKQSQGGAVEWYIYTINVSTNQGSATRLPAATESISAPLPLVSSQQLDEDQKQLCLGAYLLKTPNCELLDSPLRDQVLS